MSFGRAYGDSDFTPSAVAEFRTVIAENPKFPGAHYCLAAALLATGEEEAKVLEAEQELKNELVNSPNDSLTLAALGKIAATHQRYSEAEQYLKKATSLDPKNPDAFLYLGQMYLDTNRPVEAKAALRQAIQLTTAVSRNRYQIQRAHVLLGRILVQEHREDEARAEMQIARKFANNTLAQDQRKLAGTLFNGAGAIASEETAADSAPIFPTTLHDSDPNAMRGLNDFEKQLAPIIADSYNDLGAIAASGSNYTDALRYFERASEWNPSLDGLDYNWGRAAFLASRFSDAIGPLSRYIRSHPNDSSILGAVAMSQFMTQNYSGCIATLTGVEENIASIPQMQYIYAESLVKTGQVSLGIKRLESLETAHPEIAEVHRDLGDALELQGAKQMAAKELRTAILLNANDPETHYKLGKIELDSGNVTAAIPELESATRLLPHDPRFHQELASAYKMALRLADAEKELHIYEALGASQTQPVMTDTESHETKAP
jgi:Flp pilus assembly protein TadD